MVTTDFDNKHTKTSNADRNNMYLHNEMVSNKGIIIKKCQIRMCLTS